MTLVSIRPLADDDSINFRQFVITFSVVASVSYTFPSLNSSPFDSRKPVHSAMQLNSKPWMVLQADGQRTNALSFQSTQSEFGSTKTVDVLNAPSRSDRTESMYSVWTRFFFHAFIALLVVGVAVMLVGTLSAFTLLTTIGPFIISAAFACLWYCFRRASNEHAL